jgi:hypothetical protein
MRHAPLIDAYAILALEHTANAQEIKEAYRRMVKRHHPDRNPDTNAADEFNRIAEAYQLLLDPLRRAELDARLAAEQIKRAAYQTASAQPEVHSDPVEESVAHVHVWPSNQTQTVEVKFQRWEKCRRCPENVGVCPRCQGRGRILRKRAFHLRVRASVKDGTVLVLRGAGHVRPNRAQYADLHITVHLMDGRDARTWPPGDASRVTQEPPSACKRDNSRTDSISEAMDWLIREAHSMGPPPDGILPSPTPNASRRLVHPYARRAG